MEKNSPDSTVTTDVTSPDIDRSKERPQAAGAKNLQKLLLHWHIHWNHRWANPIS